MDSLPGQDPFLWDVDAVVKALCVDPGQWTKDPAALAATLREEELDGRTLLTFDETCSRKELFECLGIRLARHKVCFSEKLVDLRARSRLYREWLANFRQKSSLDAAEESPESTSPPAPAPNDHSIPQAHPDIQDAPLLGERPKKANGVAGTPGDAPRKRPAEVIQPNAMAANPPAASAEKNHGRSDSPTNTLELSQKRRRVQPVNLATKPLAPMFPWENQPDWAYLGPGKLPADLVRSPNGVMSSCLRSLGDGEFTVVSGRIPAGRRAAVNRIVQRLLRRNSLKEARYLNGEMVESSTASDVDEDTFGLSDLPSELDEETLREMEEERLEEENRKPEQFLSRIQVQGILNDEIDRITSKWKDTKVGQLERRAYHLWTSAERGGSRAEGILKVQSAARHLHRRIQTLSQEILNAKWKTEDEVRFQAQVLEPSVKEKARALWLAGLLESRVEPPRPPPMSRQMKSRPKRRERDAEALTSSDDDYDGDAFVVSDDEEVLQGGPTNHDEPHDGPIDLGWPLESPAGNTEPQLDAPVKREPVVHFDLTQSFSSPPTHKTTVFIDLTTPTKGTSPAAPDEQVEVDESLEPPSIESLESVREISSVEKGHWTLQNDRWRLAIYMLNRFGFVRRSKIFELIKGQPAQQVWDMSVAAFISSPPKDLAQLESSEEETLKCDISRVFLSFVRCRAQTEQMLVPLKRRNRKKIESSRDIWFDPFCDFVGKIEPLFPRESQIYRAGFSDLDVHLGDDGDDSDPDPSTDTPSKRRKAKEIVQNKDALDLREREKNRARDQDARRQKLRATLATSASVSKDYSRLIINETKQEDESLLYVNEDIGTLIKDHQVEGVRFLWNQIIQDCGSRQGCLLAHTMGLGKTMQVITFLVAVAEASKSPDPSLRSQIPEDLRRRQTIILCPAGLVDNWMDELLKWAPPDILGPLRHLDAVASNDARSQIISAWADLGGVLVVGYNMFVRLVEDEKAAEILLGKPNIVVADEAHKLKNPESKVNRVCSNIRTTRRIALTGSPLANNVEEYYSMINWVAPNFLGPIPEFREIYVSTIQAGLWSESKNHEKREALKMLQVLKETVASKVNRATVKSCLAQDLPQKFEFVITVPPTPLQRTLYNLYIDGLSESGMVMPVGKKMLQSQTFSIVNDLTLICNHPYSFYSKVKDVKRQPEKHRVFPRQILEAALKKVDHFQSAMDPSLSLKVEHMVTILDESRAVGDKVLVFSQSLLTLDYLDKLLKLQKRRVCRLDGSTSIDQRQEKIKDFNVGNQEVYLISTTAGGVGLNIQGANRVVIFDSKWNPVNDQQAIGRAYRLGQTKKVFVYYLMVAGTVEEALHSKSVFKTQLASRIVDKKNPISWGSRNTSLVRRIQEVEQEDLGTFAGKDRILDRLIELPRGPGGVAITKIVSTDTFEEEDVNTNLTAEERRQAESLVLMNRLRQTDPEEYERRKAQERAMPPQLALNTDMSVDGMGQVYPGGGERRREQEPAAHSRHVVLKRSSKTPAMGQSSQPGPPGATQDSHVQSDGTATDGRMNQAPEDKNSGAIRV